MNVLKINLISFFLVLSFLNVSLASASSCQSLFARDLEKTWRPGDQDSFMAMRSNAPHFWSWAHEKASRELPKSLLTEGWAAGDVHVLNFGELSKKSNHQFNLELVDLDDSGRAPLIFDVLRLMVSVKMSPAKIHGREIWEAYVKGLEGKEFNKPDFIQDIESWSDNKLNQYQEDFLNQNIENEKMRLTELGLKDMKLASVNLKKATQEIRDQLLKSDPHQSVVHTGWKVNSTGGSQGMPRIWMLLKDIKNNSFSIREFKQMASPATGNYTSQPDHIHRILQVKKAYWKTNSSHQYSVIKVDAVYFLSRNRMVHPINEAIKKAIKLEGRDLNELSLYLGFRLGQLHAQQPSGTQLLKSIEKIEKQGSVDPLDLMRKLRDEYIEFIEALKNQKSKRN